MKRIFALALLLTAFMAPADALVGERSVSLVGPTVTVPNGLVAYWPLDNLSAKDVSSFGNNGTIISAPTQVPGQVSTAFGLTGSNGYSVAIAAGSALDFTTMSRPTISFWIKVAALATARILEETRTGGWGLESGSSGQISFGTFSGVMVTWTGVLTADSLWHQVLITYDGTNARLYKDSVLVSAQALSASWTSSASTLFCGGGGGFGMVGSLDEVRVWNRPLGQSEITAVYAANSKGHS
jgi:hypothetical protein